MPWPIGRLPIEEPEYSRGLIGMIPMVTDPGQVDPGRRAEAELAHPAVEAFGPSFWPIITDPTFEDWARISVEPKG